jgi:hypothetical protein
MTPDAQFVLLREMLLAIGAASVLGILFSIGRRIGLGNVIRIPGIAVLLLVLAVPGGLLAVSLALDQAGQRVEGQVIDKRVIIDTETEAEHPEEPLLDVRYSPIGQSLPPFTSTTSAMFEAQRANGTQEIVSLPASPAEFERYRPGDTLDLRILRLGNGFSLVRPTDQSTWTIVARANLEHAVVPYLRYAVAGLVIVALASAAIYRARRARARAV